MRSSTLMTFNEKLVMLYIKSNSILLINFALQHKQCLKWLETSEQHLKLGLGCCFLKIMFVTFQVTKGLCNIHIRNYPLKPVV